MQASRKSLANPFHPERHSFPVSLINMSLNFRILAYFSYAFSTLVSTYPFPITASDNLSLHLSQQNDGGPFYWRVQGTDVVLRIAPRPIKLPPAEMRVTINNVKRVVQSVIRREGDYPITRDYPRGRYDYPTKVTGIGMSFLASYAQKMTWGDVNNALTGLYAALYERELYQEASFVIYHNPYGEKLEEEGTGDISGPRAANNIAEI